MFDITILMLLAAAVEQPMPTYDAALRCAGLTEAAMGLRDESSSEGEVLFDAALFWGLTASERARKDGHSAARFIQDQLAAKERAAEELGGEGSAAARTELASCLAQVPPLGD